MVPIFNRNESTYICNSYSIPIQTDEISFRFDLDIVYGKRVKHHFKNENGNNTVEFKQLKSKVKKGCRLYLELKNIRNAENGDLLRHRLGCGPATFNPIVAIY